MICEKKKCIYQISFTTVLWVCMSVFFIEDDYAYAMSATVQPGLHWWSSAPATLWGINAKDSYQSAVMFGTDSVASVKAAVPLLGCDCSLDPGIKAICPSTDTWRTWAQHGHMSSTVTSSPLSLSPGCIDCSPSVSSFFINCIQECVFCNFAL